VARQDAVREVGGTRAASRADFSAASAAAAGSSASVVRCAASAIAPALELSEARRAGARLSSWCELTDSRHGVARRTGLSPHFASKPEAAASLSRLVASFTSMNLGAPI
jgi:hypothetical protein